ncbi:hypothetical protein [Spirosoma jeollabukense]
MKKLLISLALVGYLTSCKHVEVPISDETAIPIPDAAFEKYLIYLGIDSDKAPNGTVRYGDIKLVDSLQLIVMGHLPIITSLKGIEHFTNLKYLNCSGFAIDQLDLSHNAQLEYLDCSTNPANGEGYYPPAQIKQLVFGPANDKLKILRCMKNAMESLNLTNLPALRELICLENSLTELDLSQNKKLSICWTYASRQLKAIYVSSLNQVDSSRVTSGPYNGSIKWFKDPSATYKVR